MAVCPDRFITYARARTAVTVANDHRNCTIAATKHRTASATATFSTGIDSSAATKTRLPGAVNRSMVKVSAVGTSPSAVVTSTPGQGNDRLAFDSSDATGPNRLTRKTTTISA